MKSYLVSIKYLSASNTKPSRVVLTNHGFDKDRLTVSRDTAFFDMQAQAMALLTDLGYSIVTFGSMDKGCFATVKERISLTQAARVKRQLDNAHAKSDKRNAAKQ